MSANNPAFDAVLNALLRAQAALLEIGSALKIQNPESVVAAGLLFEANCARSAALDAMLLQQRESTPSSNTEG